MSFDAFTEPRISATLEFVDSLVASFTTNSPLRFLELEWGLVDFPDAVYSRLRSMIRRHFIYFRNGTLRFDDSEKVYCVYRFQNDTRHATLLSSWLRYPSGNRSLLLRLFDRELLLDDDGYLQMNDELRKIVAMYT